MNFLYLLYLLYNLLQVLTLAALGPLIVIGCLLHPKYRARLWQRLGFGLTVPPPTSAGQPRIWVHALSVGEVRSAWPLLVELRRRSPAALIFLSTTTATGRQIATGYLGTVDALVAFPFDILPVVRFFFRRIKPDVFVLVETDFWPNVLACAKRRGVPSFLANGRISSQSYSRYQRAGRIFRAIFGSFTALCMQTEEDVARMLALGVPEDRVVRLGNLKYDAALAGVLCLSDSVRGSRTSDRRFCMVAGSTHPGEEEIVLSCAAKLKDEGLSVRTVIAPRDINRAAAIAAMASDYTLRAEFLGDKDLGDAEVTVVDSLGRLVSLYADGDLAFVGGSLVPCGGHNPLEAAVFGRPVLFGPHMEDFAEIRDALVVAGGARIVEDGTAYCVAVRELVCDPHKRQQIGQAGKDLVAVHRGAAARLAELVFPTTFAGGKKCAGREDRHGGE